MKDKIRRLFRNMNPAMVIIVVILLADNFLNGHTSLGEWIYDKVMILPGIIIGLTFHEAAHGYASHFLEDPTPKYQGRLTLNPFKHIDPIGFLCLMFAGFGWGVPVQIDPRYYKHRRRDEFIVNIAGVTTNFIIAVIFSFIVKWISSSLNYGAHYNLVVLLMNICIYIVAINIVLMIFNLLPVPPLDGFGIVTQIFNLQRYEWWWTIYKNGSFILMVMIIFDITSRIIDPIYEFFLNLLLF